MPNPFPELRERLLRAGVAPRHVRRYITELSEHLADLTAEEVRAGRNQPEAKAAALARLGSIEDLAEAMLRQPKLRAWSVRAPWAVCALAPLGVLALARGVALLMLWSGWQMFLPGASTPFGAQNVSFFGNAWFQLGRAIYIGAPFVLGWALCVLAARQRLRAWWPALGIVLVACIAALQKIEASRAISGAMGHIRIYFALGRPVHGVAGNLLDATVIFSIAMLPYLIWRWRDWRSGAA